MGNLTERQSEIVEKAITLISEKGIQHFTIKNLAERMNISEPALYRHFNSKLAILHSILIMFEEKSRDIFSYAGDIDSSIDSNINGSISANTMNYLNLLELFFQKLLNLIYNNKTLSSVIFSEEIFQNDKSLSDAVFHIMETRQQKIISLARAGQNNKTLRQDISAKHISLIIIGTLRFLITQWKLSDYSFNLLKEGKDLWVSIGKILEP